MDFEKRLGRGITTEKLTESNFRIWYEKNILILAYREVDFVLFGRNSFLSGSFESEKWSQSDKLARMIIRRSLSDDMLEYVWGVTSVKEIFDKITNFFQRHTLLHTLRARRDFYSTEIKPSVKMLSYINGIQHLGSALK